MPQVTSSGAEGLEKIVLTLSKTGGNAATATPCTVRLFFAEPGNAKPGNRVFDVAVQGTGCFPPRGGVRVVWVGVQDASGPLATCQSLCEEAFADLGFAKELRAFVPHLTLGRVKDPRQAGDLRRVVADYSDFEAGIVPADELVLFESRLSPQGATYVPIPRAPLAPA